MYLYRKVLILSLLMQSVGLNNEIVSVEKNNNSASTVNHKVVIHQSLDGRDIYEDFVGDTQNLFWDGSLRMRANVYTMTTDRYLIEQQVYFSINTSTTLHFVIYECISQNSCLLISNVSIDSGTGEGYYSSGDINVFLENGNTYVLGTSWEGTVDYYRGVSSNPSFGDKVGLIVSGNGFYPPPENVSYEVGDWASNELHYNTKYITSDDPPNYIACPDILGDVNDDSSIDILDVLTVVDFIINNQYGTYDSCLDINGDLNLNVLDIMSVVNIILDN